MMKNLYTLIIIFWWALTIIIGFLVVPLLFILIPDKSLAGNTAAHFFEIANITTIFSCVALYILASCFYRNAQSLLLKSTLILAALCAAFNQFIAAANIIERDNLALWHNLASISYLIMILCATIWLAHLLKNIPK